MYKFIFYAPLVYRPGPGNIYQFVLKLEIVFLPFTLYILIRQNNFKGTLRFTIIIYVQAKDHAGLTLGI